MVSAVIITHNRLELLKKAIESALRQTYKDMEIIVVNDNSTDGTKEYLGSIGKIRSINIDAVHSKGGNYARNQGIRHSRGEYIAFLDDDDEWLETKIEKQVQVLEASPEYGMVYARRINSCEGRETLDKEKGLLSGDLSQECFTKTICTSSGMMVRRELFSQIGLFDENLKFWQDFELNIRIANACKIGYISEPLFLYRVSRNQLTKKYNGWLDAVHYIEKKHEALFEKLSPETKKKWELMVYRDAAYRCRACGLKKKQKEYRYKVWKLSGTPVDFIRYVINH